MRGSLFFLFPGVLGALLGLILGLQISQYVADPIPSVVREDAQRSFVPSLTLERLDGSTIFGKVTGSGALRLFLQDKQILPDGSGAFRAVFSREQSEAVKASIPNGALFVASSRGKYYYPVGSSKGEGLSPKYRLYFQSAQAAERAGFKPGG